VSPHAKAGSASHQNAVKKRDAVNLIKDKAPDQEVDGEMHAEAASDPELREASEPDSRV
jgi:Phosphotransacetylase